MPKVGIFLAVPIWLVKSTTRLTRLTNKLSTETVAILPSGVLYFQISQYRDALDAYSRAIHINPYISEVWFDLGILYESCNNQITDTIDMYAPAAELDLGNVAIAQRLQLLNSAQVTGSQVPAPRPQDVHLTAYASSVAPPPFNLNGPPLMLQPNSMRPPFRSDSRDLSTMAHRRRRETMEVGFHPLHHLEVDHHHP